MRREGVGEGKSWNGAALEAFKSTAWALGVVRSGAFHLEADVAKAVLTPTPAPVPISAPLIAPAPPSPACPPDPVLVQRVKTADEHIRGVVEVLKEKGKGGEAARLICGIQVQGGEAPHSPRRS